MLKDLNTSVGVCRVCASFLIDKQGVGVHKVRNGEKPVKTAGANLQKRTLPAD